MSNKAEATSTNANHTTSVYEALLPKLTAVLELTQNMEGPMTPQAKQALLFAVSWFWPVSGSDMLGKNVV